MSKPQTIQILREHHISPTIQRIEIAQILLSKMQHLSAEQVLAVVNVDKPKVSKATVYNTLGLFARKGLIKELIIDPSKVFYDSNVSDHHHFYNVDTHELMDISSEQLSVGSLPTLPDGTETDGVDVIIRVRSSAQVRAA
ncbi:MAG: transcriptional repressor [Gammaproteobacteria bacterium]|nr:transcriptional repressor [Gammaproteobacteria bacterium]